MSKQDLDLIKITDRPYVSIIVPVRNEEKHIKSCLEQIINETYPKDRLEIIVVDGMSNDHTREIIQEYAGRYPFVRILENPKIIQATAMNIGIREAKGEIIIRMDAHTNYDPDYISQCVVALQTKGAANVGGMQRAIGTSYVSNTIAIATNSPFGVGNARFRYSEREEWVDSVYLGAWHKRTLEDLGGFNEAWVINEDYELNYRLRRRGGKILLCPDIRCQYYVRDSISKLALQYFRYGLWKVKTLIAYPESVCWRQLVPPAFTLVLIGSFAILPVFWVGGLVVPGLYVIANLFSSLQSASRRGWKHLLLLPLVFATMHLSWGVGFWAGIIRFGVPRIPFKSLIFALLPDFRHFWIKYH